MNGCQHGAQKIAKTRPQGAGGRVESKSDQQLGKVDGVVDSERTRSETSWDQRVDPSGMPR